MGVQPCLNPFITMLLPEEMMKFELQKSVSFGSLMMVTFLRLLILKLSK